MPASTHSHLRSAKPYLVGLGLALALTIAPFALVAFRLLPPATTFTLVAAAAAAQVLVHLRCFLHLQFRPGSGDRLLALCFTAVLLLVMIGGSLWIMADLQYRMLPG